MFASFLLPLAAHSAVISSRQTEIPTDLVLPPYLFGSLGGPPPLIKNESIRSLQPQISKQAKRELIRWGPFEIPGMPGVNVCIISRSPSPSIPGSNTRVIRTPESGMVQSVWTQLAMSSASCFMKDFQRMPLSLQENLT
jgi:hypothetical protein